MGLVLKTSEYEIFCSNSKLVKDLGGSHQNIFICS